VSVRAAQRGITTRNYTSTIFKFLRDDIYMLGVDGTATGSRIAPHFYHAQYWLVRKNQIVNGSTTSSKPFRRRGCLAKASAHSFPHTVRAKENQTCSDCHVSPSTITTPGGTGSTSRHEFYEFHGPLHLRSYGDHGLEAVAVART